MLTEKHQLSQVSINSNLLICQSDDERIVILINYAVYLYSILMYRIIFKK